MNRLKPAFHETATTYKQGARTLDGKYYNSPEIFQKEKEKIFAKSWNVVGRRDQVKNPGDYFLCTIADESIIVTRDAKNTLHAFFNVCRHRGTRLCEAAAGQGNRVLQCPYHAWTYGLDGKLIAAPHMHGAENFDKGQFPLHEAHVAEWEGFIFINIAKKPTPFEKIWKTMFGRLSQFNLSNLVVGHRATYDIHANWKLVFQNYNECLHCPSIHPELSRVLPFDSAENDLIDGPFVGGPLKIKPGNQSATMTGRACGVLVSDKIVGEERTRAYYYTFMPNMFLSLHPDYCNYYIIEPISVDQTRVTSEWMFHPRTLAEKKHNIQDAIDFWDTTNRQDWDIIERSASGIRSSRYVPGPYSPRESIPAAWDREYLRQLKK